MADSIYDQAAVLVASGIKTNVQLGGNTLPSIPVRTMDWEDLTSAKGDSVSVRIEDDYDEGRGTNNRDLYRYPCHVFVVHPRRPHQHAEFKTTRTFMQAVRRYFHNQRRMSSVSDSGTNQITCYVTEGPIPPRQYREKYFIHSLTVWTRFMETRTNN